jgi:hypothetical protein
MRTGVLITLFQNDAARLPQKGENSISLALARTSA